MKTKTILLITAIFCTTCGLITQARSIRKLDKEVFKHEDTFRTYETDGESNEAKKDYASIQRLLNSQKQLGNRSV